MIVEFFVRLILLWLVSTFVLAALGALVIMLLLRALRWCKGKAPPTMSSRCRLHPATGEKGGKTPGAWLSKQLTCPNASV